MTQAPPDVEEYRPSDTDLAGIEDDDHPAMQKAGLYVLADERDELTHYMVWEFIDEGIFDSDTDFQANLERLAEYADAHLRIGEQVENGEAPGG